MRIIWRYSRGFATHIRPAHRHSKGNGFHENASTVKPEPHSHIKFFKGCTLLCKLPECKMHHSKDKTTVLGNAIPVLGVKLKRG